MPIAREVVQVAAAIAFSANTKVDLHESPRSDVAGATVHQETFQLLHHARHDDQGRDGARVARRLKPQGDGKKKAPGCSR